MTGLKLALAYMQCSIRLFTNLIFVYSCMSKRYWFDQINSVDRYWYALLWVTTCVSSYRSFPIHNCLIRMSVILQSHPLGRYHRCHSSFSDLNHTFNLSWLTHARYWLVCFYSLHDTLNPFGLLHDPIKKMLWLSCCVRQSRLLESLSIGHTYKT